MTKRCIRCGEVKALDEFNRLAAASDGLNAWCKVCMRAYNNARYHAQADDPEFKAAKADRWLRYRYGIDRADYDRMLAEQGGGCATCGTTDPGSRAFHVDHDHATGRVRGLLCSGCNVVLGHVKDDPVLLRELADYLERAGADVQF